ncbi:uncharacterized protein LOC142646194 [Dermatophagoides pteronyssinus]|uniref:uncharacterized protein LOC142646194 n=1 Tax=Dermatophagoides pteronyssinus TaxID=6956 RepID=UPI003F672463
MIRPMIMIQPIEYIKIYCHHYIIFLDRSIRYNEFNHQIRKPIQAIHLLMIIWGSKCLYYSVYSGNRDKIWRGCNLDIIGMISLDPMANIFCVGFSIQISIYIHMLYYWKNQMVRSILEPTFVQKQTNIFHHHKYRHYNAIDYVWKQAKLLIGTLLLFVWIIYFACLLFTIIAIKLMIENFDYFTKNINGYIRLLQLWSNTIVMQCCYFIYGHANILISSICQTSLIILNMKIWQSEQFLNSNYNDKIDFKYKLSRFQETHIKNLKHTEYINEISGPSLLIFLFINMPSNCYLIIFLLDNNIDDWIHNTCILILCLQQIICILCFHLAFAISNQHYHRPSKSFLSLLIRWRLSSSSFKCLRYRLKSSYYIQAFHTDNRYGFTYGKLELISMMEFVKYMLLYSQLLMFVCQNFLMIQLEMELAKSHLFI